MSALLEVRNLSVHFARSPLASLMRREVHVTKAVDDVSFSVARGACLGLVGESGCGKSTLSRTVMRLIAPTSGHVLFDGEDVHALGGRQLFDYRRRAQMIFQDPFGALNPRRTAGETLEEVLAVHGMRRAADRDRAIRGLLDKVGLPADVAGRRPASLSGGQCQRIGIARALAVEPELIIADEALSALDVSIQAQILNLLGELRRAMGLTMLFVSHDLGVVRYLCDEVVVMNRGRLVEHGSIGRIFEHPASDYTRSLLAAMPSLRRLARQSD
ncbi:MAG: ATP-binding cassette domain-containing protein [Parvibaculaceae bacterium]